MFFHVHASVWGTQEEVTNSQLWERVTLDGATCLDSTGVRKSGYDAQSSPVEHLVN